MSTLTRSILAWRALILCLTLSIVCAAPVHAQDDPDLFATPFADWATPLPDGKRLLFVTNAAGNQNIWVSGRDGTNPSPLINWTNSDQVDPDWSPDGQHIAFASNRGALQFNIWIMNPDGTNAVQLTTDSGDIRKPRHSP